MARKHLRIQEIVKVCRVERDFILRLEREDVIHPVIRQKKKLYPPDQVERIRVARLLVEEMGVNLEGTEVVLHMREQMIAMQRQFNEILRLLNQKLKDR